MLFRPTARRLAWALFFLASTIAVSGCGPGGVPLGTVSGQVTKGGKPQKGITVRFEPAAGGRGSEALTDANGNYELNFSSDRKGAVLGKHKVTVMVKEKYNDFSVMTSPAKVFVDEEREVQSGSNNFSWDLDKPATK